MSAVIIQFPPRRIVRPAATLTPDQIKDKVANILREAFEQLEKEKCKERK